MLICHNGNRSFQAREVDVFGPTERDEMIVRLGGKRDEHLIVVDASEAERIEAAMKNAMLSKLVVVWPFDNKENNNMENMIKLTDVKTCEPFYITPDVKLKLIKAQKQETVCGVNYPKGTRVHFDHTSILVVESVETVYRLFRDARAEKQLKDDAPTEVSFDQDDSAE